MIYDILYILYIVPGRNYVPGSGYTVLMVYQYSRYSVIRPTKGQGSPWIFSCVWVAASGGGNGDAFVQWTLLFGDGNVKKNADLVFTGVRTVMSLTMYRFLLELGYRIEVDLQT